MFKLFILVAVIVFVFNIIKLALKPKDRGFVYITKHALMSEAEKRFYNALKEAVENRVVIFSKVRLADIFDAPYVTGHQAALNKILCKHIDFLLCTPGDYKPLAGIELDDKSHLNKKESDDFKDGVFLSATLPLYRIKASGYYDISDMKQSLKDVFANL